MHNKNIFSILALFAVIGTSTGAFAAVKKTQSAIQTGTNVRAATSAAGLYDQECYDAYYGCMDQFCITENADGGSCGCSDLSAKYEERLAKAKENEVEAERIETEEVLRVQAGGNADIVFTGKRYYDDDGNIISAERATKTRKKSLDEIYASVYGTGGGSVFGDADDISNMTGAALYAAADELCREMVSETCEKDYTFLSKMYARQITADCKAFENSVAAAEKAAQTSLAEANAKVRDELQKTLAEANKYTLGECMVEFRSCMQKEDACGTNWENCVFTVASENMQNQKAKSTARKKVATTTVYNITDSTMEILSAKRPICERVLNQCVAVSDQVWPAFLREVAPSLHLAESNAESKFRQSCLTNIANCITTACQDNIAGTGGSMDACLSNPDMVRSFCKVEIDPCERMEPLIWGYVTDKLAAMRVDACTTEVKECFTDDIRCGADFSNCIGMDFDYIHEMCPLDKLVVCKANNPNFSMDDLDSMLMGLYLNLDNSMLENCQALVEKKMMEVCGSTTDCNRFATDDTIGTSSLQTVKNGDVYRVTGMISFGNIKVGSGTDVVTDLTSTKSKSPSVKLKAGEIGVNEYIANISEKNASVADSDAIISTIDAELKNIAGTINRVTDMIEQDVQIQYCINGRDLSQITGKDDQKTTGRYPNLLNSVKSQIAIAALRQAQDNYNAKFNSMVTTATQNASADLAEYMCNRLPMMNGGISSTNTNISQTDIASPYAIAYEFSGISDADLASLVNSTQTKMDGATAVSGGKSNGKTDAADVINSFTGLGTAKANVAVPGGTKEMWSIFNRETFVCHFCTAITTQKCESSQKKGFMGIGNKTESKCEEATRKEECQDIQMGKPTKTAAAVNNTALVQKPISATTTANVAL